MRAFSVSIGPGSPWTRHVSDGGVWKAAQPPQDFVRVGVRRHRVDGHDPGLHRDLLAVDARESRAVLERAAARAGRLISRRTARCSSDSGSARARWCSTRPPVAMPLDEMTIAGAVDSCTARDSAIDATTVSFAVQNEHSCRSARASAIAVAAATVLGDFRIELVETRDGTARGPWPPSDCPRTRAAPESGAGPRAVESSRAAPRRDRGRTPG